MRAIAALLFSVALGACNITPEPAFWDEACAHETGVRVYESVDPAPLAMTYALNANEALLNIGASAVELPDSRGRYLVTWNPDQSGGCRDALAEAGFNSDTHRRVGAAAKHLSQFGFSTCYLEQKLGEFPGFVSQDAPIEEQYAEYASPYVLRISTDIDPRSRKVIVNRNSWQIVRRSDGVVIGESIRFSYYTNLVLDVGIAICGPGGPVGETVFDEQVFGRTAGELDPRPS